MKEVELQGRLLRAAKTDAEWTNINPLLKRGEKIYIITCVQPFTVAYKIGDGIHHYIELDYYLAQGQDVKITSLHGTSVGVRTMAGALGFRIIEMSTDKSDLTNSQNVMLDSGYYIIQHNQLTNEELQTLVTLPEAEENDKNYYSIYMKASGDRVGIVTAVEYIDETKAKIYVAPYQHPNKWHTLTDEEKQLSYDISYIFFDKMPDIGNIPVADCAVAFGCDSSAMGNSSFTAGANNLSLGKFAFTSGNRTIAGYAGHAQNLGTKALGLHSNAQNYYTQALGRDSDAGGRETIASGERSFSRGYQSEASGLTSATFGTQTKATGENAISTGFKTVAAGKYSETGGHSSETGVEALYSVSKGYNNKAKHKGVALFGRDHISSRDMQLIGGQFSKTPSKKSLGIIGIGTKDTDRKNGLEVHEDGTVAVGADAALPDEVVRLKQLSSYQKQTDENLETSSNTVAGAINELNNKKLDKKEAIIIIDVTEESTQESVQELLDLAYGEVVLNVLYADTLTLNIHKGIKSLVVQNGMGYGSLSLEGAGKYSGTSITSDFFIDIYISNFTTVYNIDCFWGSFNNCHEVYNSTAERINNCDEVYDINLYQDAPDTRRYSITNCHKVENIYISSSDYADETTFSNCGSVNAVFFEDVENGNLKFTSCDYISDVELRGQEPYKANIEYINCRYVNPYTCESYLGKIDVVDNQEFVEYQTQVNADILSIQQQISGVEEELQMINKGGVE